MPSRRRLEHLKAARAKAIQSIKRKKAEARSPSYTVQLDIDDDKLSTTDTRDTKDGPGMIGGSEEEGDGGLDKSGWEVEQCRTERAASAEAPKWGINWNSEGESQLRGLYGKGSKSSLQRQRKSARESEKQASETYSISALWQRNLDLGMSSAANSHGGLGQSLESQPPSSVPSPCLLSEIPQGGATISSQLSELDLSPTPAQHRLLPSLFGLYWHSPPNGHYFLQSKIDTRNARFLNVVNSSRTLFPQDSKFTDKVFERPEHPDSPLHFSFDFPNRDTA